MRALALVLAVLLVTPAAAQKRVDPDRLDGTWKLVFDIDADAEESALGRVALRAVAGLLEEVEVRFAFLDDARLRVMVDAFGEKDEDWSEWHVAPEGYLVLGESEHFDVEDTVWLFDGDRLVAFERDAEGRPDERSGLSLVRL